jgi:putative redox protein
VAKPPITADLAWSGDLRFAATSAGVTITIDGDSHAGPSPLQALAFALAGCMSADIVHILRKARHDLRALSAHLAAERAPQDPHRFVRIHLQLNLAGAVPLDAAERAIALSRDTYCSVWHSLNPDIDFKVTLEIAE